MLPLCRLVVLLFLVLPFPAPAVASGPDDADSCPEDLAEAENWTAYNARKGSSAKPSKALVETLHRFFPGGGNGRLAIDLGSGHGTDALFLLEQGWRVLAIDADEASMLALEAKFRSRGSSSDQASVLAASFEDLPALPPAHFINARRSLPFTHPVHFKALWQRIVETLRPMGVITVDFFGPKDFRASKAHSIFTLDQALDLFRSDFETIHPELDVVVIDEMSVVNHWELFSIMARKKNK